jgi:hypothetical protein
MTTRALLSSLAAAISAATVLVACGGSSISPAPVTTDDAGTDAGDVDAAVDAGDPVNPTYPADHSPIPLVNYNGGRVMTSPKIVTITFSNDQAPLVARLQEFGDKITATPWWAATTSEYCDQPVGNPCVGPGSGGGHVVLTDAPAASYVDSSQGQPSTIQDFIKAKVADATFPAPTDQTIYAIYFPQNVDITLDGSQSCGGGGGGGFGAYHNTIALDDGKGGKINTPYAIMPRCGGEATTTTSASHEFVETATDPDIGLGNVTYYMQNQLWAFAGGEVGDLCVDFTGGNDTVLESTFTVQRSWSNKAAKASHNPCVPVPNGEVYFNAAARAQKVVLKAKGDTTTLDIDAFSDAPMADWTISGVDFAQFQGGTASVSFSFDKTVVHNGSHVVLTLTALKAIPAQPGGLAIVSKSGKQTHYWPVLLSTK